MLRSPWIALVATLAFIGPADCSENPATVSRNGGQVHVAAFRPPGEVIVDDNGNLTDDGQRLLHYDYKNRLVAVSDKASMGPVAAYEYLPDGRRAKKVVFAPDGQVAKATAFFYDGAQEVEEQEAGSGVTEATYVWSPVYVDELVTYTNASGTFYTHQDARCDVVAITDAAGTVVERVRFDDFGRAEIRGPGGEVRAASAVGCAYGFQGRRLDAETGLLYFRARYYDPETGRFVQRDPVWDAGNVGGQYTFVGNNPASMRDPSGRAVWTKLIQTVKKVRKAIDEADRVGGAYYDLRKHAKGSGDEIHHMPSWDSWKASTNMRYGDAPSIRMSKEDHMMTTSWGSSAASQAHRLEQSALIQQGRWKEAMDLDVKEIKKLFPDGRYDQALKEMQDYVRRLEKSGALPRDAEQFKAKWLAGGVPLVLLLGQNGPDGSGNDEPSWWDVASERLQLAGSTAKEIFTDVLAPRAMQAATGQDASIGDVLVAGAYDLLNAVDPVFVTDGAEGVADNWERWKLGFRQWWNSDRCSR